MRRRRCPPSLDQDLYSITVVMALVTTAMTGPLLTLLERRRPASDPVPEDAGSDDRPVADAGHPTPSTPSAEAHGARCPMPDAE